ncbi:LuxR C-terminal-related transcriptional regulator, partial [Rhodococcus sp. NPDC058514]
ALTDYDATSVAEICRRLDGLPLAIELAAARVRAMSPAEIVNGLNDRFQLLTGGARTAVPRQQTLRASVDWSHTLLTEPERTLFRRLAVFRGGFDVDAAHAVCGDESEAFETLDGLAQLVDKSLVTADDHCRATRYRLLETVRQYALEKLGESGEADAVRARHRDYYTAMAVLLDAPGRDDYKRRLEQAETEIDNLRGAFTSSRDDADPATAMTLASSLQPLWLARRVREGHSWLEAALAGAGSEDLRIPAAVRARALADLATLDVWFDIVGGLARAREALAIARDLDDPTLVVRALTACLFVAGYGYNAEMAEPYFTEAIGLARSLDDRRRLCHVLTRQAETAIVQGNPSPARMAAEEGLDLAEVIGDVASARECRINLAWALLIQGDLRGALAQAGMLLASAYADHDQFLLPSGHQCRSTALVGIGDLDAARVAADAALDSAADIGGFFLGLGHSAVAYVAVASGDLTEAGAAGEAAWGYLKFLPQLGAAQRAFNGVEVVLASGDLDTARTWADEAVSVAAGWQLIVALTVRARIERAAADPTRAAGDAHAALDLAAEIGAFLTVPNIVEVLAELGVDAGDDPRRAARLFGAADAMRERSGPVRFAVHQTDYDDAATALRNMMSDSDFDTAWTEGAALSTDEAIAYARRGRGDRGRPATGWDALTPAERDVVRLVGEGLTNRAIAARLFVSPRTVQSHLTHVFTKLGLSSRVQLAQEATRHA